MNIMTLLPRPELADRSWTMDAACRPGAGVPADLFAAVAAAARATALHVCHHHCPVRGECHEEAGLLRGTEDEYRSMVVGGVAYNQYGKVDERPLSPVRCPLCTLEPGQWPDLGAQEDHRGGRRKGAQLVPCGTEAGYCRHRRRKERACDPCRAAHNGSTTASKRRLRGAPAIPERPDAATRAAVHDLADAGCSSQEIADTLHLTRGPGSVSAHATARCWGGCA